MKRSKRNPKRLCRHCRDKKAGYYSPLGNWKSDHQHDLCPRCYCSLYDSVLASLLAR